MSSLLRADIRRIVRPQSNTHWFLVVLLAVIVLAVVLVPVLVDFFNNANISEEEKEAINTMRVVTPLGSASTLLLFGLVPLLASLRMATLCWADMRSGFIRTIVSACGKKTYYIEKLVLALVVSFAFLLIGFVLDLLITAIAGGFTDPSPVLDIIIWVVLATLLTWACASLTLTVLWLVKSNALAYILGISLGSGLISSLISLALGAIPAIAEVWAKIVEWFPISAVNTLNNITNGGLAYEALDYAHVLVPIAVCLAIAFACASAVMSKRDL